MENRNHRVNYYAIFTNKCITVLLTLGNNAGSINFDEISSLA